MTRPLEAATKSGLAKSTLPLSAIIRLDIVGDPLFAWTGVGDLSFGASETGDPNLDGQTFLGTATAIEIGTMVDGKGGSDVLELGLAGVDIQEPMLKQLIYNRNKWQFKRALVWLILFDPDTGAIAGKPFRVKTGRIDKMPYSEDKKGGMVKCRIEGQQSYGSQPLSSRYSEQKDINPLDISQNWIYSLANMTAEFGTPTAAAGSFGGGGYGGGGLREWGFNSVNHS